MRIFTGGTKQRVGARGLFAVGQSLGQARGQSRFEDFLLRLGNIVVEPAEFDRLLVKIVNDVSGFGDAVARLTNAADVDKILAPGLDFEFRISPASHNAVANNGDRHMAMPEKADASI